MGKRNKTSKMKQFIEYFTTKESLYPFLIWLIFISILLFGLGCNAQTTQNEWLGLTKKEVKQKVKNENYEITYRGKNYNNDNIKTVVWRIMKDNEYLLWELNFSPDNSTVYAEFLWYYVITEDGVNWYTTEESEYIE